MVAGSIEYLAQGSVLNRRYLAPDGELNTGRYGRHTVTMHDARPDRETFTLDRHGFALVTHHSAVADFTDKQQVASLYPGEIERLLLDRTGADKVLTFGWLWRDAKDDAPNTLHPATDAHVDYNPARGDRQARTLLAAAAADFACRRIIGINLWRAYSEPPQDWPLAMCDGNTVGADEGVTNTLCLVDRLPEPGSAPEPVPDHAGPVDGSAFHYNSQHRWYYFPNMTRDELLMFKLYDSNRTGAWRVPHTAFHDTSRPDAKRRKSIEIRAFAYFK